MTAQQTTSAPAGTGTTVSLRSLRKTYGSFAAVDGIDLDVREGEFLTLLGASGSGKTTTLSMVAGFATPSAGQVLVGGNDVTGIAPHKRNIGMVFQHYSLFPHMSVLHNVAFPLRQRGVGRKEREQRAREALDAVELSAKASSRPTELSGGQQQRVAIARALVFGPSLLLMDAPFGARDRALREMMQLELRRIHREIGVTVLFVTHDQQEALTLSDRIAVFENGRIAQVGTPEDLYDRPESLYVATFLGESNVLRGTADGGAFATDGGAHIAVDPALSGRGAVVLRPERLTGGAPGTVGEPGASLDGTVIDVTYLGADRRVDIETPDGPIVVRTSPHTIAPASGEQVSVGWDPAAVLAFPGAGHVLEEPS